MGFKKIILTLPSEGYTGETVDYKLTAANLKNQPELEEAGYKVGDTIKVLPLEDSKPESNPNPPAPSNKDGEESTDTVDSEEDKKAYKRAAEIAEKMGVDAVFANDKGEFFTSKNLAILSVGQDKKRVKTYNF